MGSGGPGDLAGYGTTVDGTGTDTGAASGTRAHTGGEDGDGQAPVTDDQTRRWRPTAALGLAGTRPERAFLERRLAEVRCG